MILLFPCRHCFASQTSNNYDFWSEYPKPAAFAIIIADTAMNPQILHYFQPKYVSYRSKMWSIFTVIKAVLDFCSKNRTMQYLQWPYKSTLLYFHWAYAVIPCVTIYMESVLRLWFSNKAVEPTLLYIQWFKWIHGMQERINCYILNHPEKVCLKYIFLSYNTSSMWRSISATSGYQTNCGKSYFQKKCFVASKSCSGSKFRYLKSLNQPKSKLQLFGLILWDTSRLISV